MQSPVEVESAVPSKVKSEPQRRCLARYMFGLFALPFCLYLAPFLLARTPGYSRWAGSAMSPALDYSFTTAGLGAQIVIYGDSSALFGISPLQMSRDLGMKVVNLPTTGTSLPIIDDLPLRYYLKVNERPKLIIFYFSPWNLDYLHDSRAVGLEGEQALLRHGTSEDLISFALKHPIDVLEYPFRVYSTGPKTLISSAMHRENRSALLRKSYGHLDSLSVSQGGHHVFANLKSPCVLPADFLGRGSSSVQRLRDKYSTGDSKVLVYLAPVPACENVTAVTEASYDSVGAARPNTLAPSSYRDDTLYVHLDPTAVPKATDALTIAVKKTLADAAR